MKRIEGRCCVDVGSLAATVEEGVGGLRTARMGAAVSARLRVMLRVPVEEAGVMIPTVGAVVEEGVSADAAPDS